MKRAVTSDDTLSATQLIKSVDLSTAIKEEPFEQTMDYFDSTYQGAEVRNFASVPIT